MAVMVDLYCSNPECDYYEEDVFVDTSKESHGDCAKCNNGILKRHIGTKMVFELKYNNKTDSCDWNGNTTQFYKNMKKGDNLPEKYRDKWY